jgi:glycerophosphoryl diester phosphodiesterase
MTALIAHRGASAYAPENTLAAFRLALELGAPMIELDVALTADERLVVIHDGTVDRTSDGTGEVGDLTLAELRALDYSKGHEGTFPLEETRILELAEIVEFCRANDLDLNVETKEYGGKAARANDLVIDTLRNGGWSERTLVSSVNHRAMADFAARETGIRSAIAFVERFDDLVAYARTCRADVLHPHHLLIDERFVDEARAAGLGINAWTVDDPDEAQRLIALGIDGVMTNRADLWSTT